MMAASSNIFTSKSSNCSIINLHSGLPTTDQRPQHSSNTISQSPDFPKRYSTARLWIWYQMIYNQ